MCQDGEKKGVSPEEVYTSMRVAGDSSILPCKWLKKELPLLLDQIRMLVATSSLQSFSDKTTTEHTVSMILSVLLKGCLILTNDTSMFLRLSLSVVFSVSD